MSESGLTHIGRTVLDELGEAYRRRIVALTPGGGMAISESERELAAAALFARDLMAGDEATFKAGYSPENAVIAALEVFPNVDEEALKGRLMALRPTYKFLVEIAYSRQSAATAFDAILDEIACGAGVKRYVICPVCRREVLAGKDGNPKEHGSGRRR